MKTVQIDFTKSGWRQFAKLNRNLGARFIKGFILRRELATYIAAHYPNIQLTTVVPHEEQANSWSEAWRDRYFRVLELSTDVITLSSRYTRDCYHVRNRYLVDNADKLLALYNGGATGGTAYTVQYARQKNKEIVVIDPNTLERTVIPPRLQAL